MPMPYTTLIDATDLQGLADAVILDCSFELADTAAGRRAWEAAHIPGARYAHLDDDLAGPKTGRNGRHPLPDRATFAATVGRWGIAPGRQVVCYDRQGGPYAARAWWLLRWLGHAEVALLDGGLKAWQAAGGAMSAKAPAFDAAPPYPLLEAAMPTITIDGLHEQLGRVLLVDARAAERFRGDVETLDPVAGHIPGALNRPFADNLDASSGCFKPPAQLRAEFDALLAGRDAAGVVHHCGSGVSAVPNVLAMELAGYAPVALYAGSWSEWCRTPGLPVERG